MIKPNYNNQYEEKYSKLRARYERCQEDYAKLECVEKAVKFAINYLSSFPESEDRNQKISFFNDKLEQIAEEYEKIENELLSISKESKELNDELDQVLSISKAN